MNRIAKFEELGNDYEQKGDAGRARMQRRLGGQLKDALKVYKRGGKIQPDQLPVPIGFEKLPPLGGATAVPQPTGNFESALKHNWIFFSRSVSTLRPGFASTTTFQDSVADPIRASDASRNVTSKSSGVQKSGFGSQKER